MIPILPRPGKSTNNRFADYSGKETTIQKREWSFEAAVWCSLFRMDSELSFFSLRADRSPASRRRSFAARRPEELDRAHDALPADGKCTGTGVGHTKQDSLDDLRIFYASKNQPFQKKPISVFHPEYMPVLLEPRQPLK